MNNLTFSPIAWDEYLYWQMQDKKTLRRINQLLKDIQRNSFEGIGKPEPLKYYLKKADIVMRRHFMIQYRQRNADNKYL